MMKTSAQRVGLALVGLILGGFLVFRLMSNPAIIDAPRISPGERAGELLQALDPNTADEGALGSIPGLNRGVARSIVEYREEYVERHPGEIAFKSLNDLDPIRGIGQATLKKVEPYLIFP